MPDSKIKVIEDYLESELDKAETALERFRSIVKALPKGCPEPTNFSPSGYCAEATLSFRDPGELQALQKALPAEPLIWLRQSNSSTFKPLSALRDSEKDADWLAVYPTVLKYSQGHYSTMAHGPVMARWWTTLGRVPVEIIVEDVDKRVFDFLSGSHRLVHTAQAFSFLPYPLKREGELAALVRWRAHQAGDMSREIAEALELKQVEQMRNFLIEKVFSLGYYPMGSEHCYLYQYFIQCALVKHTGIKARVDIFSSATYAPRQITVRLSLDSEYQNESFYDLEIPQETTRRLKLKDIPVDYPKD